MKPLFGDKIVVVNSNNIILKSVKRMLFSLSFVNVIKNFGLDNKNKSSPLGEAIDKFENHSSISALKSHGSESHEKFEFRPITKEELVDAIFELRQ